MDILLLNSEFQVAGVHTAYYSLVWTERYVEPGDFQIVSYDITTTLSNLPLNKCISLRDTEQVMFVESQEIGIDADGVKMITITGRSVDAFLNFRAVSSGYYQKKARMALDYIQSTAAACLIWNAFVNTSGKDVVQNEYPSEYSGYNIPWIVVTDSSKRGQQNQKSRWTSLGNVHTQVREFLGRANLGLRTIRPGPYGTEGLKIWFRTGDAQFGTPETGIQTKIMEMRMDIYQGVDRRDSQTANEPLVLRADEGDFTDVSYLFSVKDFYNVVGIVGPEYATFVRRANLNPGFSVRHMINEVGDVKAERRAEYIADLKETGWDELRRHSRRTIFSGKVASDLKYKYNVHYGLGDRITVRGEYGYKRDMYVAEYFRSFGPDGVEEYPALVELFNDNE